MWCFASCLRRRLRWCSQISHLEKELFNHLRLHKVLDSWLWANEMFEGGAAAFCGLLCKLDSVVFCNHFVSFPFTENVFVLIWACFLIDTATAQTHNQSTMMRGFRWHKLRKNNEAKFKNVNINTLTCLTESFTLQPEFHLSQR